VLAPAGTVVVPQASAGGTMVVAPAALALRAGFGRIESILAVPNAAAGSTAASSNKRIVMRMEDGSVQYFDTAATDLAVGDRVEITSDGTLRHPL
jgi:plastocyanin